MITACLPVEARVLVQMICDPEALAICDDLETSDLVHMPHVMVLHAIRQAQQWDPAITVDSVLDAIEHIAMDWGSPEIAEKCGASFIADMISRAPKPDSLDTIRDDLKRLRTGREYRAELIKTSYAKHGRKYQ
jgi:hypothetical protein